MPFVGDYADVISAQRSVLEQLLSVALQSLAERVAPCWDDVDETDNILSAMLGSLPVCQLLYTIGPDGRQISSNISRLDIDRSMRGQNLRGRPYLPADSCIVGFRLSDVYISQISRHSCLTATMGVLAENRQTLLGCLAADFDLRDLPQHRILVESPKRWRQIRGDPAIRQTLFQQERSHSAMDERIDEVHDIVYELIVERDVFHAKLHYSGSRATLWLGADPFRYRVHVLDEIINPSVCLAYPRGIYPESAVVPQQIVRAIFARFESLRLGDEVLYLRTASLNIINGMVGLNFSCDGTHYIPALEFLETPDSFWFGLNG